MGIICCNCSSGSGYISSYILKLFKSSNTDPCVIPMCISTDINGMACLSTSQMIKSNQINHHSECICMDLFNNFRNVKFDIILFNPPYVVGDEEDTNDIIDKAWNGGINGSETIINFINTVKDHMTDEGYVYLLVEKRNKINEILLLLKEKHLKYKILQTRKVIGEEISIIKFSKSII